MKNFSNYFLYFFLFLSFFFIYVLFVGVSVFVSAYPPHTQTPTCTTYFLRCPPVAAAALVSLLLSADVQNWSPSIPTF